MTESSNPKPLLMLGIETSCDETAASVVSDQKDILSNIVLSQVADHQPYGGVVPEIAARAHIEHIETVIAQALSEAKIGFSDLAAIAATGGPGLIGGVIVGVMTGKAIASVHKKPFIAVNHLEGHALTVRLMHDVPFPYLLLLVSGGHCQFLVVKDVGKYQKLGGTVDDALGEAYDKTAKLLGLPYPGGPAVEAMAKSGNDRAYTYTVPMQGRDGCDFSFSGLKTAVRQHIAELEKAGALTDQQRADICASFQYTAAESVADRTRHAIQQFKSQYAKSNIMVVAGGVAANQYLRARLENIARKEYGMVLLAPPLPLCTDNAAMIAWAGIERFKQGMVDKLDFEPRARWPLVG
jgi:N6-L-threonylcarbamoyladenine synthase